MKGTQWDTLRPPIQTHYWLTTPIPLPFAPPWPPVGCSGLVWRVPNPPFHGVVGCGCVPQVPRKLEEQPRMGVTHGGSLADHNQTTTDTPHVPPRGLGPMYWWVRRSSIVPCIRSASLTDCATPLRPSLTLLGRQQLLQRALCTASRGGRAVEPAQPPQPAQRAHARGR